MRRYTLFFVLSLTSCALFGADVIRSVEIKGNRRFSASYLQDLMTIKQSSPYDSSNLAADIQSIFKCYQNAGYYFADIRYSLSSPEKDSSGLDLELTITEGETVPVGMVLLEGALFFDENYLLARFQTRAGSFFDRRSLENDILDLLHLYGDSGYAFTKIEVKEIVPYRANGENRLKAVISVDEGERIYLNRIQISGNEITKDIVIIRQSGAKIPGFYDDKNIARIQSRLNRLNIFMRVGKPEIFIDSLGAGLYLNVQEGNSNTFDGILGYSPSRTGGLVTGMIKVGLRNLFGTARSLGVFWLRDERLSQEVQISYTEPWLFNYPVSMNFRFRQRKQDTIYVRRDVEIRGDLPVWENITLGGLFFVDEVIPASTALRIPASHSFTTGLHGIYDSRDDNMNPSRGLYYQTDYRIGKKTVADKKITTQSINLNAEYYIPFSSNQVGLLGFHGKYLTAERIEMSDLYRFGGMNTLRGYRENQLVGSRIAWTNFEYRWLTGSRSSLYGFYDTGYYYLPGQPEAGSISGNGFLFGYGIGVRVETVLGLVGVNIGFGKGDTFLQGKLHFGLIRDF